MRILGAPTAMVKQWPPGASRDGRKCLPQAGITVKIRAFSVNDLENAPCTQWSVQVESNTG